MLNTSLELVTILTRTAKPCIIKVTMDNAERYTFKQRAEELMKALKRKATEARQQELDRIKEILSKSEK